MALGIDNAQEWVLRGYVQLRIQNILEHARMKVCYVIGRDHGRAIYKNFRTRCWHQQHTLGLRPHGHLLLPKHCVHDSQNYWTKSNKTCWKYPLSVSEELIRFWTCDLIFKVTGGQKVTNQNHSCVHNTAKSSFQILMKLPGIMN